MKQEFTLNYLSMELSKYSLSEVKELLVWLREFFNTGSLGIGYNHYDIEGKIISEERLIEIAFSELTSSAPNKDKEGERHFNLFKDDFIAHADRLLRDRGASNKDVFECLELALNDFKYEYSVIRIKPIK